MNRSHATAIWMIAAFCTALVLAAAVWATSGTGPTGTARALRLTACFSYLLFWGVYAGGTLTTLFGPTFQPIRRHVREFGLAFAAAQLVYVGLVIWLYQVCDTPPISGRMFWLFTAGLIWTYLLALFSIRPLAQALGQWGWRLLRLIGLETVSVVFLINFIIRPFGAGVVTSSIYIVFIMLSVAGTILRIGAWASRGAAVVHRT